MDLIKISQLDELNGIVNNDFFPLVDSGSLTTFTATFDTFADWAETNATASHALHASSAKYAISASQAISCSLAKTASYLLYQGFFNGTASYALNVPYAISASYVDTSNFTALNATYAISASWASSSISASYITASNIEGIPFTASYAVTASYAITASKPLSSSYAITASYALTASHVKYAESCAAATQLSVFGPFFADPNSTFVYWGQYDESKRCVAFILDDTSDVIVKCLINYENIGDENSQDTSWYIGVQLLAEGLSTPIASGTHNNEFNAISMETIRGQTGNRSTATNTTELVFRVNSLTKGQYRAYVLPCVSYRPIRVLADYVVSASNADMPNYNLFLADQNGFSPQLPVVRIPKFANSVQVVVHSNKNVRQGIYSTTTIPGPDDPPASPVPTWKRWSLTYAADGSTNSNGNFEWNFLYNSSLGNGEANWWGPNDEPQRQHTIYLCLPSDYVLTSTQNGPTGTIIRGPTVTSTGCTP